MSMSPVIIKSADKFQHFLPICTLSFFEGVGGCRSHSGGFLTSVLFNFGLILTGGMFTKSCICFFMAQFKPFKCETW